MEKITLFLLLVIGCHCGEIKINIAIVNSTTIKDLKTQTPPENKYVVYVYAKSEDMDLPDPLKYETTTIGNEMEIKDKYCIVRVEEDDMIKYYNGTIQQVRDQGKNVIDLLCEGDIDPKGDKALNRGTLASLAGGGEVKEQRQYNKYNKL